MNPVDAAGLPDMTSDIWPRVHAERAAMIDDLERIDDAQWALPSLCDGWSVHDVVAHMVDTARTTRLGFVIDMVRTRFDFDRQNALGLVRGRGTTPRQTLDGLREVASTSTPPAPIVTRLVEEILHGEDIRRPLGLTRAYPQESVVGCLQYLARTGTGFGGAKERIAGVRLTATDADLSLGDGPDVRGSALALLVVASGRRVALDELDGPGAAALAERV
jgi:uncharacterized protein (TIGR03083 family)